jgi:glucose-1-phosphate cytidylyltransferase
MKAVILAGGLGTRIAEESDSKPKPMVEIGERPLLWHIMKSYSQHGICEFVICLGYKGYMIKEYFLNYYRHTSDLRLQLGTGREEILNSQSEDWSVILADTGAETLTGGRVKRVAQYLDNGPFCLTYGDGLSDIDISAEIAYHKRHGRLATIAAVRPPGRFGVLSLRSDNVVETFSEKPADEVGWINGGFFVLERQTVDYIEDDSTSWEQAPLRNLARDGQLVAYPHVGFWQPCDTLRDKRLLETLWHTGRAPWVTWNRE